MIARQAEEMLGRKESAERRAIAAKVGGQIDAASGGADREAVATLARLLARDIEEAVRDELARSVKLCPGLPKDVAMRIAHDVEAVAGPFLEATPALDDDDLRRISFTICEGARAAVARRIALGRDLAELLCDIGGPRVVADLARNPAAPLSDAVKSDIVLRFQDDARVISAMAGRTDLSAPLARRLAEASRPADRRAADRAGSAPDAPAVYGVDAVLDEAAGLEGDRLFVHLRRVHAQGRLCFHTILRALRQGELGFFEAAMAVRAGIPLDNARRLTRHGGAVATARLCEKARVPADLADSYRDSVETALARADKATWAA